MNLPGLKGLMQPELKCQRQIQTYDGPVTSVPQKNNLLSQEDDHSHGGERSLPEDIWCHIHSLMPLQDAARSACVSRTYLRSWRCFPKLIFSKETLGLKQNACGKGDLERYFTSRVDGIMKNHSGAGVKTLKLVLHDFYKLRTCHLDCWLQNAITPGIEEVTLWLPTGYGAGYNFPCSLLRDRHGNSIRHLYLKNCAFRSTVGFDCLRSLTKLHLYAVRVTEDELGCLMSNSFALEELELKRCMELTYLKIPFWLERLSCLTVTGCYVLQVIESAAPNLSTFDFYGEPVQLSLGKSSQVKTLYIEFSVEPNCVCYAITKLPGIVPRLEILVVSSTSERVNTPLVADKFLHLKHLNIYLGGGDDGAVYPTYDYLSLASFLDASPVLESFILNVDQVDMKHASDFGDDASNMRQIPVHKT